MLQKDFGGFNNPFEATHFSFKKENLLLRVTIFRLFIYGLIQFETKPK